MSSISICIASRNHAPLLKRTLDSIFQQRVDNLEVIVTDDGSTDNTPAVVARYPAKYFRLENSEYHNAVTAKNTSLRAATGDIIIQQSDDVIHASPNCINELAGALEPGTFCIATVYDWDTVSGRIVMPYTGEAKPRPLFFLGSCWREDVCKVGGYDPRLADVLWHDDDFHADGLIKGLGLKWKNVPMLGLHQAHHRPQYDWHPARVIYQRMCKEAEAGRGWFSSSGPWPYKQGVSVNDIERA